MTHSIGGNELGIPSLVDLPWGRPLEERKQAWWWCEETEKPIREIRKLHGLDPDK